MKTYPVRFAELLDRHGCTVAPRLMWEIKGPPRTSVAWLSCYCVGRGLVIVESYRDGGWEAFTALPVNDIKATIDDVLARCEATRRTIPARENTGRLASNPSA